MRSRIVATGVSLLPALGGNLLTPHWSDVALDERGKDICPPRQLTGFRCLAGHRGDLNSRVLSMAA
jgi:hypothetical protein